MAAQVTDMSNLKDLEPLSQRLKAAQDDLNQSLQAIQDRLNALGLGVETWVNNPLTESDYRDLDDETGRREQTVTELGYGRLGDGWALLVRDRRIVDYANDQQGSADVYEDDPRPSPLLRASRSLRAAAVRLIPSLIEQIESGATEIIRRVEEAKKIADSLK